MKQTDLFVARVLNEDDDFITLEVGKRDDVVWHLQQNDEGETVSGDRFFTIVYMRSTGPTSAEVWNPFE